MNPYKDDFHIGQRFKYLNTTMLVTGFIYDSMMFIDGVAVKGGMIVNHIGDNGEVVRHIFIEDEYESATAELNRSGVC